jgi:hypothetical protein
MLTHYKYHLVRKIAKCLNAWLLEEDVRLGQGTVRAPHL